MAMVKDQVMAILALQSGGVEVHVTTQSANIVSAAGRWSLCVSMPSGGEQGERRCSTIGFV